MKTGNQYFPLRKKEVKRERETDRSIHCFLPLIPAKDVAGPGMARNHKILLGLPYSWQGPKHLDYPLLLFSGRYQGIKLEVEQPGHKQTCILDTNLTRDVFTYCETPALNQHLTHWARQPFVIMLSEISPPPQHIHHIFFSDLWLICRIQKN